MFLDFDDISKKIPFATFLDSLNIAYTIDGKNLKGKVKDTFFIVDTEQNKFFTPPDNEVFGSVINFLSFFSNCDLRTAAIELNAQFLVLPKQPKRELPNLKLAYHPYLEAYGITKEMSEEFEVGIVSSKSIFSGKLAFKIYDNEEHTGYVAYDIKNDKWIFPQNFKRPLYNYHGEEDYVLVVASPLDCILYSQYCNCVSLLGVSMTDYQYNIIREIKRVILLVKDPQNIVNRLYPFTCVKAPFLIRPIQDYSASNIADLIRL